VENLPGNSSQENRELKETLERKDTENENLKKIVKSLEVKVDRAEAELYKHF